MSLVTEIITPLIKLLVYFIFGGWILYLIYRGIRYLFPNLKYHIKYSLLRKEMDKNIISDSIYAMEKGWDAKKTFKQSLLKGNTIKEAKELVYIYGQIKKMKGGD